MKKLLIGLAAVVVLAVVAVLVLASGKSDTIHFDRSITIEATAADMAPFAEDLKLVNAWSPWNERDPDLVQTWSDESTGVGAWYAWEGNDDVGKGKQTIASAEPGKVVHHLEFIEPFEDEADAGIAWEETGEGEVTVTWGFTKDSSAFGTKVMQVFMDFEAMIGPDYEYGLEKLKPMVEEAAAKRIAEEEAAAAKAAEEAQAAADLAEGEEAVATE